MIFVDKAVGSASLIPLLREKGLVVEPAHLEWADVEFVGKGVKDEQVLIGIEMKRLSELTGDWERLAGEQVPKMTFNYAHRYLVYEGEWQQNKKGVLFQRTGRMSFKPLHGDANASRLRKKLLTLEMCAGMHVHHVSGHGRKGSWSVEAVRYIHDLYRWWTDDNLEEHSSHIVMYEPLHHYSTPSILRRAAAVLPGIGITRSKAVEDHFKSIRAMVNASEKQWMEIEGVGIKLARKLVEICRGL